MKWRLFIYLVFTFIAFTIIGTQTHEYGHYAAATYLGMAPSLHYQSVAFGEDSNSTELNEIALQFEKEIDAKKDFSLRKRYEALEKNLNEKDFYSRLWGPLQTMITGTIGFILILIYRKKILRTNALLKLQWLFVFLSLFWSREVFNTFVAIALFFVKGERAFYGDEFILSEQLNLHQFTIPIIAALIGLIICSIVTFKFVPLSQRKIFIASGFVGGVAGFILWMYLFGPKLLP